MVGKLPGNHPQNKSQRIKLKTKTPCVMERNGNNAEGYFLNDTHDGLYKTDKQNARFSETVLNF